MPGHSGDGTDQSESWRSSAWSWWCRACGLFGLLFVAVGLLTAASIGVTGEPLFDDSMNTFEVVGEGSFEGEDVVSNVSLSDWSNLRVNLSKTPSEAGISEAYIYSQSGERLEKEELDPTQTSVVLETTTPLEQDYRVMFVDGSNQAVYDGTIFIRSVEYA